MEAKDTVMQQIYPQTHKEHLKTLQAQAEISFKAGYDQGRVVNKKHYLLGKGHGIREVVEWVETIAFDVKPDGRILVKQLGDTLYELWQAKLKDWELLDDK